MRLTIVKFTAFLGAACFALLPAPFVRAAGDPVDEAAYAMQDGRYQEAEQNLRPLAESGNARAQVLLGMIYGDGIGREVDVMTARQWFHRAAKQGYHPGQLMLGLNLLEGERQDPQQALVWLKRAGHRGNSQAQRFLALAYAKGWMEMEPNPEKARYWLEKSGLSD